MSQRGVKVLLRLLSNKQKQNTRTELVCDVALLAAKIIIMMARIREAKDICNADALEKILADALK